MQHANRCGRQKLALHVGSLRRSKPAASEGIASGSREHRCAWQPRKLEWRKQVSIFFDGPPAQAGRPGCDGPGQVIAKRRKALPSSPEFAWTAKFDADGHVALITIRHMSRNLRSNSRRRLAFRRNDLVAFGVAAARATNKRLGNEPTGATAAFANHCRFFLGVNQY